MTNPNYTEDYFSTHARDWLAGAYGDGVPPKYPVGTHRVRIALQALANLDQAHRNDLIDLGCGDGELCMQAAASGMRAMGVDIAEGMLVEAERRRQELPSDIRERVSIVRSDVLSHDLPAESFDAVVALGLIEYLPEDKPFFDQAYRLLRPGGIAVVSCRNRLFNMTSLNAFTMREVETGGAPELLSELQQNLQQPLASEALAALIDEMESLIPKLREALEKDYDETRELNEPMAPDFEGLDRQHTPAALTRSASDAGFGHSMIVGMHPHPLPPTVERHAPRFYNQFARVLEPLEALPLSRALSSAFVATFQKSQ